MKLEYQSYQIYFWHFVSEFYPFPLDMSLNISSVFNHISNPTYLVNHYIKRGDLELNFCQFQVEAKLWEFQDLIDQCYLTFYEKILW